MPSKNQATTPDPDVDQPPTIAPGHEEFALEGFLPYRLSILTQTVSGALARLYADRFGLSVPQWRVMAVLGRFQPLSANDVCEKTVMDKVAVSRAVAAMLKRGLVERTIDRADRRRSALRLTRRGQAIHRQIVPLALHYERRLLDTLSPQERKEFNAVLDRLLANA